MIPRDFRHNRFEDKEPSLGENLAEIILGGALLFALLACLMVLAFLF